MKSRQSGRFAQWVAVLALIALGVVVFLPALVNWQVNRILRGLMAHGAAEFRLVHAGLRQSDVAISFDDGGPEGPPLEVASCSIGYRPLRLLAGHVDSIVLSGVVLHVVATNDTLSIPVTGLFASSDDASAEPFSLKRLQGLPITLNCARIGGTVVVHALGEALVIPVKAEAAIRNDEGSGWDVVGATVRVRFSSSAFDGVVKILPATEAVDAQVRVHAATDALPILLRARHPDALRRGLIDLTARAALRLDGAAVAALDVKAKADVVAETTYGTVAFQPVLKAVADREKIEASLTGLAADVEGLRLSLDATNIVARLASKSLDGALVLGVGTNAPFDVAFHASPEGFAVRLGDGSGGGLGGAFALDAIQASYDDVRFEAKGTRDPATGDGAATARLSVGALSLRDGEDQPLIALETGVACDASASITGGVLACKVHVSAGEIALPPADATARNVALDATWQGVHAGEEARASAHASVDEIALASAGAAVRNIALDATWHGAHSGEEARASARASVEEVALLAADAALRQIELDGAWRGGEAGGASANAKACALFRDVELARLEAGLVQTPTNAFGLEARVAALGVAGTLKGDVAFGAAGKPLVNVAFDLPEQALDLAPVYELVPGLADYAISGKLFATGKYQIKPDDQKGAFKVRFSEGVIECPAQEFSVSGVRASFEMPNLPTLASNSQFLGFKNLKAKRFSIDSGMAIIRMQSPEVWFLDNLVLDWCGGKVRGESTRISRSNKHTWITLHADQLRLADLLPQFGLGTCISEVADEGGRLSGTIPVVVTNGKIVVRDGYFHSAPGKTGRIRLSPAPRVLDMAGASIETSLAVDALADFTYKWIRIALNSEGEDLLLKFEMDGRPSKKLKYSIHDGEIVRSRNTSKFEGLVLDTNFRIPLNELISIALPLAKSLQDVVNE
ncbi:MAG: intermembrane phospholipid transport protein YdbH family protein [Kiritimatiellia bacterium]